jgi:hypothetical protein
VEGYREVDDHAKCSTHAMVSVLERSPGTRVRVVRTDTACSSDTLSLVPKGVQTDPLDDHASCGKIEMPCRIESYGTRTAEQREPLRKEDSR